MAFPLYVLKGLQMKTHQKLGVGCVFSLAILVVIFDILRTVFSVLPTTEGAVVILTPMCDILEASIAVIISCLPVYRTLFMKKARERPKVTTQPVSSHRKFFGSLSSTETSNSYDAESMTTDCESGNLK